MGGRTKHALCSAAEVAYDPDENTISLTVDWDSSDDEEREGDEPDAPEEVLGIQRFLPAQETDAPPKPATRARVAAGRTLPDDAPAVSPRDPTAAAKVAHARPVYATARLAGAIVPSLDEDPDDDDWGPGFGW